MSFGKKIDALYRQHGPTHILPFIGRTYDEPDAKAFRVAVVGINAYASTEELRAGNIEDATVGNVGNRKAWTNVGVEGAKAYRFQKAAYAQVTSLAKQLTKGSRLFKGLAYDEDPKTKSGRYTTNAVKVFTSEAYKSADGVSPEMIWSYTPTWQRELDAMAEHGVLPHLIVILGECVWEAAWRAFSFEDVNDAPHQHFKVTEYETSGEEGSSTYHYANRITVTVGKAEHTLLLVRLHHPSAHSREKKDAAWLVDQPHSRRLAGLA